jgi:hypothetical protein
VRSHFSKLRLKEIDSVRGEAQLWSALNVLCCVERVDTTQFGTDKISHHLTDQLNHSVLMLEETAKISKPALLATFTMEQEDDVTFLAGLQPLYHP